MGWEGPVTWRQFEVWQAWLDMQWNEPSRSDWYLMRVAANVLRAAGDKDATEEKMRLRFVDHGTASAKEGKGGVPPTKQQVERWKSNIARDRLMRMGSVGKKG